MAQASDVTVRPARVEDAEAIARVQVAAWRRTYAEVMDREFLARLHPGRRAEAWRGWIASPSFVVVAERAGTVIGFAGYGDSTDDDVPESTGQVYSIYVEPAVLGTGIGAALMNRAVADLAADGFTAAVLWVLEANPLARSFYERGGWRPDGGARNEPLGGASLHVIRYRRPLP